MRGFVRSVLAVGFVAALVISVAGCNSDLKAAGEQCFGTAECEDGLTCDFGVDPPVCSTNQTTSPDGAVNTDDAGPRPDGAAPDAPVPDAPPVDAGIDAL